MIAPWCRFLSTPDRNTVAIQLFFIFLVAGLILVGAEVFIPGGIVGAIGALALLIAVAVGFVAFPGKGAYIALSILFLCGLAIYLWIRIFPNTGVGRRMMVANDLKTSKATEAGLDGLIGQEGTATSQLRPAGYAQIGDRRIDVITQGGMIAKGDRVRVIEVEGNRVVVKRIEEASEPQETRTS